MRMMMVLGKKKMERSLHLSVRTSFVRCFCHSESDPQDRNKKAPGIDSRNRKMDEEEIVTKEMLTRDRR